MPGGQVRVQVKMAANRQQVKVVVSVSRLIGYRPCLTQIGLEGSGSAGLIHGTRSMTM